jgi:hypothetical protein
MEIERRFNEKETALILRRAAQLQARETGTSSIHEGFSLPELETAAGDAGVSAEFVRLAAAEVAGQGASARVNPFLGEETGIVEKARAAGAFDREDLEAVLIEMPDIVRSGGTGSASKDSLSWSLNSVQSYNSGRSLVVRVVPSTAGGAEIQVKSDLRSMAGGLYGSILGGLGLVGGLAVGVGVGANSGNAPLALLFSLGTLGLSYVAARLAYVFAARWTRRENRRIAGALQEFLESRARAKSGSDKAGTGASPGGQSLPI